MPHSLGKREGIHYLQHQGKGTLGLGKFGKLQYTSNIVSMHQIEYKIIKMINRLTKIEELGASA